MVIDTNVAEESHVPTATADQIHSPGLNGLGKSPAHQNNRRNPNKPHLRDSNRFAALSSTENDRESLSPIAADNPMDVEEPLPVTNHAIEQDNMDVEIRQTTSAQISDLKSTMKNRTPNHTFPVGANDEQVCDTDSLGSE